MIKAAVLAVTERSLTRKLVVDTPAGRHVADRFVAGETLAQAVEVATTLNSDGLKVSMDHLGEHITTVDEAVSARNSYLACVAALDAARLDANISVKLTQLGLGVDSEIASENIGEIAAAAQAIGTTVTIDMEESIYTDETIAIYETVQAKYGNLGVAIQSYLRRTAADLDRIIPLGGHIRLCKGAYAETEDVAYQSDIEVNEAFDRLSMLLMTSPDSIPAIASHDDARLTPVLDAAVNRHESWEFQMLYGVRRDRQRELAGLGHNVRIYVPYGEAWYPYLTRRMAERPANLMFFARALVGR